MNKKINSYKRYQSHGKFECPLLAQSRHLNFSKMAAGIGNFCMN